MATRKKRTRKPAPALKVEFNGQEFTIPRLSPGRDIDQDSKVQIAEIVCLMYETDEFTLEDCLLHCGIQSDATWRKWLEEIEEIEELYNSAIKTKDSRYRYKATQRARTTLENYLQGWKEVIVERVGLLDPETGQVRSTHVREKEVYIRPSMRAVEFTLTNFDGKNFTKSPEPFKAGNERMPTDIKIEILGGELPPVTREQDIKEI